PWMPIPVVPDNNRRANGMGGQAAGWISRIMPSGTTRPGSPLQCRVPLPTCRRSLLDRRGFQAAREARDPAVGQALSLVVW
ncbi:MAG: hypothetical protein ACREFY_10330, partial [Acetobacteraceae bacterium]